VVYSHIELTAISMSIPDNSVESESRDRTRATGDNMNFFWNFYDSQAWQWFRLFCSIANTFIWISVLAYIAKNKELPMGLLTSIFRVDRQRSRIPAVCMHEVQGRVGIILCEDFARVVTETPGTSGRALDGFREILPVVEKTFVFNRTDRYQLNKLLSRCWIVKASFFVPNEVPVDAHEELERAEAHIFGKNKR
jgi:hypothetical protein